jgi:hypothetical protein
MAKLFPNVAVQSRSDSKLPVRLVRRRTHARCIDPAIVEIEQCADRNCAIESFIGPSDLVKPLYIISREGWRLMIRAGDEPLPLRG